MLIVGITLETTGADLYERNTAAVVRIHVRMDLEDEAGEVILFRIDHTFNSLYRTGRRSDLDKTIQQLFHTEVIQGRAEEYRGDVSFQISIHIELRINTFDQFDIRTKFISQINTDMVFQFGIVDVVKTYLLRYILFARSVKVKFLFIYIIYTFETLSHIDRPAQRAYLDLQFFFYLIQKIERIFTVTVHLVDKHDHRRFTHTADFHQFTCLCFHTFGNIDHDNDTVYGR